MSQNLFLECYSNAQSGAALRTGVCYRARSPKLPRWPAGSSVNATNSIARLFMENLALDLTWVKKHDPARETQRPRRYRRLILCPDHCLSIQTSV